MKKLPPIPGDILIFRLRRDEDEDKLGEGRSLPFEGGRGVKTGHDKQPLKTPRLSEGSEPEGVMSVKSLTRVLAERMAEEDGAVQKRRMSRARNLLTGEKGLTPLKMLSDLVEGDEDYV
jgi:hypothetical protein